MGSSVRSRIQGSRSSKSTVMATNTLDAVGERSIALSAQYSGEDYEKVFEEQAAHLHGLLVVIRGEALEREVHKVLVVEKSKKKTKAHIKTHGLEQLRKLVDDRLSFDSGSFNHGQNDVRLRTMSTLDAASERGGSRRQSLASDSDDDDVRGLGGDEGDVGQVGGRVVSAGISHLGGDDGVVPMADVTQALELADSVDELPAAADAGHEKAGEE